MDGVGGASVAVQVVLAVGGLALTVLNTWVLLVVRNYREDIAGLRRADHDMRNHLQTAMTTMQKEMGAIQVLVAGNYVTRDEFHKGLETQTNTLLRKFDEFERFFRSSGDGR